MRGLGRVLLTGRSGFIGGNIAAELLRRCTDVVQPTRDELDLTDAAAVIQQLGTSSFDTVLHFASRGARSDAEDDTLIAEERAMASALLPVVRKGGTFFFAGSMSEYGRVGRLNEETRCTPQNAYGRAKLETGLWLRENASLWEIEVCVGRIFGAYGAGEAPSRLLPAIVAALREGQPIDLSDGRQVRDFVHVRDVVDATLRLVCLSKPPDCVNIGSGVGLTVRTVVEHLAHELAVDLRLLRFGARGRSPHDLDEIVADTSRLSGSVSWVPPQRILGGTPLMELLGR